MLLERSPDQASSCAPRREGVDYRIGTMGRPRRDPAARCAEHGETQSPTRSIGDDLISANYVRGLFGDAQAKRLLAEAEILASNGGPGGRITHREFWRLCLKNVNATNDEGHGCTPHPLPKSTWQVVYSAVNQMDAVADGLRQFADVVPVVRAGIAVGVGYGRNGVHLNFAAADPFACTDRSERYLEVVALTFHCVLLWITGQPIRPVQVRLSSRLADEDGSPLAGLCPSIGRHGGGCTVVYDRADMALPLGVRKYRHRSDETRAFEELCSTQRDDASTVPVGPVVDKIRQIIACRPATLQQIAPALGMSVATLQRRLRESGTSFRDISKEVRQRKLISLLSTDVDLDDIAEELGLSERRSLWRTCHEWLGVSPSEFRRAQRPQLHIASRLS